MRRFLGHFFGCCALALIDRKAVVGRHTVRLSLPLDPTAVTSLEWPGSTLAGSVTPTRHT